MWPSAWSCRLHLSPWHLGLVACILVACLPPCRLGLTVGLGLSPASLSPACILVACFLVACTRRAGAGGEPRTRTLCPFPANSGQPPRPLDPGNQSSSCAVSSPSTHHLSPSWPPMHPCRPHPCRLHPCRLHTCRLPLSPASLPQEVAQLGVACRPARHAGNQVQTQPCL